MVSFITIRYKGMLYKVSLEPMTTLHEVLTNFCEQHQVDPELWCFKHHRLGFVAMNSPFSLTGVEPNAQLEMTLAPADAGLPSAAGSASGSSSSSVTVALEIPSLDSSSASSGGSRRFTHPFPPSATLWDILSTVEDECGEHLVTRTQPALDPQGVYMIPVVRLMRRSFDTIEQLKKTRLSKLGFQDGNVLIRLDFKVSDPPMYRKDVQQELRRLDSSVLRSTSTDSAMAVAPAPVAETSKTVDKVDADPVDMDRVGDAREALYLLKRETQEEAQAYLLALNTLLTVTRNVANEPDEPKYRSLKLHNKLQSRIGRWSGAREFLRCVGFVPSATDPIGEGVLVLDSSVVRENILACLRVLEGIHDVQQRLAAQEEIDKRAEEQAAQGQWSFIDPEEEAKQAEELRKKQEKLAPVVSVFDKPIVSADDDADADADLAGEDAKQSTPASASTGKVSLSDIRNAIDRRNFPGASDEQIKTALKATLSLSQNLLKSGKDVKPAFRDLNPSNEKFRAKVGRWPACNEILRLLGFRLRGPRLTLEPENEERTVTERIVAILKRTVEEQFTQEDWVAPERDVKIYDLNTKVAATPVVSVAAAASTEDEAELDASAAAKEEQRALMMAFRDAQKQNSLRERFTTREQREADRLSRVAQYDRTLVRVTFKEDNIMLRAYLHPKESINELFLLLDNYVSDSLKQQGYHLRIPPATRIARPVARKATVQTGSDTLQKLGLVPAVNLRCWPNSGSPCEGMVSKATVASKVQYEDDSPPQRIGANSTDSGAAQEADKSKQAPAPPTDDEMEAMMAARMARAASGKAKTKTGSGPKKSGSSAAASASRTSSKGKGGFSLRDVMAERKPH